MSHLQHEYDWEPVRGLPERLPAGERILWQGSPDWRRFARHVLRTRWVAGYFALLAAWPVLSGLADGDAAATIAAAVAATGVAALLALGLLALGAIIVARTTIYTVTNRRVVLRIGIALTKAVNLPFARIADADLLVHADGSGDIALAMREGDHVPWLHIAPHARPWRLRHPQPSLRAIPDAANVARLLAGALQATGVGVARPVVDSIDPAPVGGALAA